MRLLVVWSSLARTSGGGRTFATGLAAALAAADDLDATFVLPTGMDLSSFGAEANFEVIWAKPLVGPFKIVRDLWMTHRWARASSADLVLIPHEWGAWVQGGVPVINVVQNVLFMHPKGRMQHPVKSTLMTALAKITSYFLSGTIAVSESASDMWRETTGRESHVLPEGTLPTQNVGSPADRGDVVLVMTGQQPYKNADLARRVAAVLALGADGPCVQVIGVDGESGARVQFDGAIEPAALAELYSRARVVVMTSDVESFGLPAFEARSAGCSVVILKGTPMAEWLAGDPLVQVVEPEPVAMANAVEAARSLVDSDRTSLGWFLWSIQGPRWVELLLKLGRKGKQSAPSQTGHRDMT